MLLADDTALVAVLEDAERGRGDRGRADVAGGRVMVVVELVF
jgi:hypothetical protein